MYRSLASVGILAIIAGAGLWAIGGQNAISQTTEGVVVKNHMSDAERDKLMQDAIDKAHKELEAAKAKEADEIQKAAEKEKAREKSRRAEEAANAVMAREKTEREANEAKQKALAEKLTKEDKGTPAYSSEALKSSDTLDPLDLDKVEKAASVKPEPEPKKLDLTEKKSEPVEKKKSESAAGKPKPTVKEPSAPEPKVTVERVSTKDPDANLTVKKAVSSDGSVKDTEKDVDYHKADVASTGPDREVKKSGDSQSVDGQVVGLMRSNGTPRLLVRDAQGRMVQVVLEDSDIDVPAPASVVSIRGKNVGGADGRMVLSASSVKVKSGTAVPGPRTLQPSLDDDEEMMPPGAVPMPPMGGMPFGIMPGPGPGPMMPGPMMMPPPGGRF